jgi:hypothetical protein
MADVQTIGSGVDVCNCYVVDLSMLVCVYSCGLLVSAFFFGVFFLTVIFEALAERRDTFTQVLAKPAQPAYTEDEEYDHQYEYELWPTNFEWHFFPLLANGFEHLGVGSTSQASVL